MLHNAAVSEVGDVEVYAKLIAMSVVGVEEAVGKRLASGFINLLTKKLEDEIDLTKAPESLQGLLEWFNANTVFRVDTYRVKGRLVRVENGAYNVYLVAYECPIRQILYMEDLPGGGSLCSIMCKLLSRAIKARAKCDRCEVEPARIGPNACLLRVKIEERLAGLFEKLNVRSQKPSIEEYVKLLNKFLSALLRSTSWALYTLLGGNPAISYRVGKSYGRIVGALTLARGYEPANIVEAIQQLNESLKGIIEVSYADGILRIVRSRFHDIIRKENISYVEFIDRTVQGFMAGVLEVLLFRRIDLRSVGSGMFKVIVYD